MLLRLLITICICVYTRPVTNSTTLSDKDKDKDKDKNKVNAVDKRPVTMYLQNLQQKKVGDDEFAKKMTQMVQQRQVAKFATKKDGQYCNGKR